MKLLLPTWLLFLTACGGGVTRPPVSIPTPPPPLPPPVVVVTPDDVTVPLPDDVATVPQFILDKFPNARVLVADGQSYYYAGAYDGVPVEMLPGWYAEAEQRILAVRPGAQLVNIRTFVVVDFKNPNCQNGRGFVDAEGVCAYGHEWGDRIEAVNVLPIVVIHEAVHGFWRASFRGEMCQDRPVPVYRCVEHGAEALCEKCDPFGRGAR